MKYLVHLLPPDELIHDLESLQSGIYLDKKNNFWHTTMMRLHSKDENGIIDTLESIHKSPFDVSGAGLDILTDSLVLKLQSPELNDLHFGIIESLRRYIDWSQYPEQDGELFNRYASHFVRENYIPHITIGEGSVKPDLDIEAGWTVQEFYLSRYEGSWQQIERFDLE